MGQSGASLRSASFRAGGGMAGGGGGRRAVRVVSDWLVVSVVRENRDNSAEAVLAPDRAEIILNFLLDPAPVRGQSQHPPSWLTIWPQTLARLPKTSQHLPQVTGLKRVHSWTAFAALAARWLEAVSTAVGCAVFGAIFRLCRCHARGWALSYTSIKRAASTAV